MANFHVIAGAEDTRTYLEVRRIRIEDLFDCLRDGVSDFLAKPSYGFFIIILYPIIGAVLAAWTSEASALPMLFPLAAGFALLGPFAALGLYEISRRREMGRETNWSDLPALRYSPARFSIAALGVMLLAIFVAWLLVAQALYAGLIGPGPHESIGAFASTIFGTREGWLLIVLGNGIGFLFALLVLMTTVISFPLLLDRDVGAWAAIETSARAVMQNPVPMLAWGAIVAVLMALGSLPLFAGLIVVMPVLGHATWHLYRKVVTPPEEAGMRG